MSSPRLHLTDSTLLRLLMKYAPAGELSVRALAEEARVSKSKIGNLLNGGPYPTVDFDTAARIARAVGVHRDALFQPRSSISMDVDEREDTAMDPTERSLRMRLASHKSWAQTADRSARTEAARKASHHTRFVEQARGLHPDATEEQIANAAESLRKAYYSELALRGVQSRRIKAQEQQAERQKRIDAAMAELEAATAEDPAA